MNVLITGPPASGKSTVALARFHSLPSSVLLTPTATMAEHLRNQLAREGRAIRPSSVQTLAHFLEDLVPQKTAPPALVRLVIQEALESLRPARFESVAEFRGFQVALAQLFEELPADRDPDTSTTRETPRNVRDPIRAVTVRERTSGISNSAAPLSMELESLFREANVRLHALGFATRNERLRAATEAVKGGLTIPSHILWDGFFSLSSGELSFIKALASRTEVTVVLPDSPGATSARGQLIASGFEWQRQESELREASRISFQAATIDQEAEEIARRMLRLAAEGKAFREIGIVLRSREPYGQILEATLARFGIPVRSYFASPLASHPVVSYLAGLVRALLTGWNHDDLGSLLRMPVSGVGATPNGDQFDFLLRSRLPGRGLPLRNADRPPEILQRFEEMNGWRFALFTSIEWSAKLKGLLGFLPTPQITGEDSRSQVAVWSSTALALAGWSDAMELTAVACSSEEPVSLNQFWQRAETVLADTPLRIPDRRRDAVALLDVFEARQWQLRVVFLCGLAERLFPHYHRQDPILGDRARSRLGLTTSTARQQEERFLFELATSRATEQTVLSYARFNEKGDEVLASFFLDHVPPPLPPSRIRPAASRQIPTGPPAPIQDPKQLVQLVDRHKVISPTSIEDFLQCPFLFFGRQTLRLKERPPKPRDRLDVLVQGSILHRALAVWAEAPIFGADILLQIFDEETAARKIPAGYRTEAVRLELLRHFETFLKDEQVPPPRNVRVEQDVQFAIHPGLSIRGRIDRVDVGPAKQALVIDYKYSAGDRIREKVEESEEGNKVQAGLYLLAAQKALGLDPAGMLYCGLRKKVSWSGWHLNRSGLERVGEARSREALQALIEAARDSTLQAHEAILSGRIAAHPENRDQCKRCDFSDICRVETLAESLEVGAG